MINISMGLLLFCCAITVIANENHPGLKNQDDSKIYRIDAIKLIDPWVKSPLGAHHLRLFFEFRNDGGQDDRLISVTSELATKPTQFFAVTGSGKPPGGLSEIAGIDVPSGGRSFELSEQGYFVQLNGLSRPVVMGSPVPIMLTFEHAGRIEIQVVARFHSPKLHQRIKDAVESGDINKLRTLRPE